MSRDDAQNELAKAQQAFRTASLALCRAHTFDEAEQAMMDKSAASNTIDIARKRLALIRLQSLRTLRHARAQDKEELSAWTTRIARLAVE